MAVLGYPQGVATALTTLFERGQRFLVRRLGTRISASHLLAPASKGQLYHLSLRLLSTQDCHSAFFSVRQDLPPLSCVHLLPAERPAPLLPHAILGTACGVQRGSSHAWRCTPGYAAFFATHLGLGPRFTSTL